MRLPSSWQIFKIFKSLIQTFAQRFTRDKCFYDVLIYSPVVAYPTKMPINKLSNSVRVPV